MLHFSTKILSIYIVMLLSVSVMADEVVFSKQQIEAAFEECKVLRDQIQSSGDLKNPKYRSSTMCLRICGKAALGDINHHKGKYDIPCTDLYKETFGHSQPNVGAAAKANEVNASGKASAAESAASKYQAPADVVASFEKYKNKCAPYAGAATEHANRCVWSCRVPASESQLKYAQSNCAAAHRNFVSFFESRPFPAQEEHFYDVTAKLELFSQGVNSRLKKTASLSTWKVKEASDVDFAKRCPVVVFYTPSYSDNPLPAVNKGDVIRWQLKRVAPMQVKNTREHKPDCIVIDVGEKA